MPRSERYYSQTYSVYEPAPTSENLDLDQYVDQPRSGNNDPRGKPHHSPPPTYQGSSVFEDDHNSLKAPPSRWSRKRKVWIFGCVAAAIITAVGLGVGLGLGLTSAGSYSFTESTAHVTNDTAFTDGGASRKDVWKVDDGAGSGKDTYKYYSGTWEQFPNATDWISFQNLWEGNLHTIKTSCQTNFKLKNNSPSDIDDIYNAIQNRANASLVDHRFILAIILQESAGCVLAKSTTSSSGVKNPGLMQTHNGHTFDANHANKSILAMVQDGTQGTSSGDGLVQNLNLYGNAYKAARAYNSGYVPKSGNLSEAAGATACYVSDVANRLMGWANATNTCPS
ncbi:Lysozyme-like domain superfamily [Teratosphaeria destructans]|uniref:Lysozyme-like domain superfamily n=1 Tax=Teratosphaeria destructans TaxID=418781 RepID=A0A9W7T1J5_9PEZI|nr:Lysozyme-like domain superfamily [Teratosphaeria destructans]